MHPPRPKSALLYVLKGLMPYTRENMLLAFSPNRFFNELEKISNYKRHTLEMAARRARQQKLIEQTAQQRLRLTELGRRRALPYTAKKLPPGSRLMIIFDIPEDRAIARMRLRRLLREWGFEQVQKSVWASQFNHQESVELAIDELDLEGFVRLYECSLLYPQ